MSGPTPSADAATSGEAPETAAETTSARATAAWVSAFAPASVSNLNCGFDLLGFAVREWGDVVAARASTVPGVRLLEIRGDGGRLPTDAASNTAGVAASTLLRLAGRADEGVELRLLKGLPLASGLGSSGASAVAAAVATRAALALDAADEDLLTAALEGERTACGTPHPDNVAPALYGGLLLIRGGAKPVVTQLPVPDGLFCALVHPHAEVPTEAARAALPPEVPLATLTAQAGNLAAFVTGLFRNEDELIRQALVDHVAEPVRAAMTPGFEEMRCAAVEAGALGSGLSGSGPTVFALLRGEDQATAAGRAMVAALERDTGLAADLLVSPVGAPGARLLAEDEAV